MTNVANIEQYQAWNGDSGRRWVEDPDRRDRMIAPVADAMFTAAGLSAGERVLDVGCGCGATTIDAARSVGASGHVTGIDLSAQMLDVARRRAELAGVSVRFEQADAQTHALPAHRFDVALSRFGTMFFAGPDAAFTNIAGALRSGGRLCLATWQPLTANEWLTIPGAALMRFGSLPDTGGGPGMFAQSEPSVIVETLERAGFESIDVASVHVVLTLGADPDDAAAHLADTGVGRAVLDTIAEADRALALEAVREVLTDHVTPDGVQLGAAVWITTATRPH